MSEKGCLILFDNNRQIIDIIEVEITRKESAESMNIIDNFLKQNKHDYTAISHIAVVNGPGSFTGVRSVILVANTIAYVHKIPLTPLSYFDLYATYPVVKMSSKRDLFVQKQENAIIEIIKNEDFLDYCKAENISCLTGGIIQQLGEGFDWKEAVDYNRVLKNIEFDKKDLLEPLYVKKPSIS